MAVAESMPLLVERRKAIGTATPFRLALLAPLPPASVRNVRLGQRAGGDAACRSSDFEAGFFDRLAGHMRVSFSGAACLAGSG